MNVRFLAPACTRVLRRMPFALAAAAAALLAACATPGPLGDDAAASDPTQRHHMIRPPADAPDWAAVRTRVATAVGSSAGVEIGAADAQGFRLQIPVSDGFATGRTEIRPSLAAALDVITSALAAEPAVAIQVIGHTDSQGSEMVNLRLSIARAEAVVEALRQRGISLARLSADGRGEADPITSNATEAGRARNRRVELLLRAMP